MKTKYLIAIADTHGNNKALGKISGSLKGLLTKYDKPLEDCAILYLGDALPMEKIAEQDVEKHYDEFARALSLAELPVIGVGGRYDISDAIRTVFERHDWHFLHGETVEWNGLKFGVYGGSKISAEKAEEKLGLPQEKFVQFYDEVLVEKLEDKEMDVFLHHTMPYNFADTFRVSMNTPQGAGEMLVNLGAEGINRVLCKAHPILDISGHLHERTASTTEQRTVFIKCHGFEPKYGFPVYYVEIACDFDGIPFVKRNVDINFQTGDATGRIIPGDLDFGGRVELVKPRPKVTCREEYECTAEAMVRHYRLQKSKQHGVIIRSIKTDKGKFKPIDYKPALTGADDISWAFPGDEEQDGGRRKIEIVRS